MLVVDAGVTVEACAGAADLSQLLGDRLVAPPLMWSEARSTLHLMQMRRAVTAESALAAHERLEAAPVVRVEREGLGAEAWRLADDLGWGRTYDAEYVALASLLGCRLVTIDRRLRRGADRLGIVVTPAEL